MTLNADLVRARCAEIYESIDRLKEFQSLSLEEFLADRDVLDIACYRLLVAIEAALALCYHISAKHLHKVPEEYAACFEVLYNAGLIQEEVKKRLQQMARFRNLLVHVYWKLDYRRIYNVIMDDLEDLRRFASAMAGLI